MQTVARDISLSIGRARGKLTGLLVSYVEDTLACRNYLFSQLSEKIPKRLEVKPSEYDSMRFSGVYIDRSDSGLNIHQWSYIDRLKSLPSDPYFILQLQYHARISRLIRRRLDVCIVATKLAQVTEKSFNKSHVQQYNTTVR